jgi:hypothetical protein
LASPKDAVDALAAEVTKLIESRPA